jgi:CheY-like chemotaxis protein
MSVLVYEYGDIYAKSIMLELENLGVQCAFVSSGAEFYEKISAKKWSFVFVAAKLYETIQPMLSQAEFKGKIVLLTGFGGDVPDKNLAMLPIPAYCIPIANILNGVFCNLSYDENKEGAGKFTAPEAKILIVDDIRTNLKVAQGLLLPYKMQVSLCKSGIQALEEIRSKDYDLVFMDHKMPGMDGIETTQRIRELGIDDPYYKNVPIVALTANAVLGTREMFLENSFDDFLSKPIDTVALNGLLEKWIPREKQKKYDQLR